LKSARFLIFAFFSFATAAQAVPAVISGRVTFNDPRSNPYTQAGMSVPVPSGARFTVPVAAGSPLVGATVRVTTTVMGAPGTISGEEPVFYRYATTDANGEYSLSFSAEPRNHIRVDVLASLRVNQAPASVLGDTEFTVKLGGMPVSLAYRDFGFVTGNRDYTVTIANQSAVTQEAVSAYRTAWEVFRMWAQQGSQPLSIPSRSPPIDVNIYGPGSGGVTPTWGAFFISAGVARAYPTVVAHEMGHILAWNMLGTPLALISPLDYQFPPDLGSWTTSSIEGKKAAFHDAIGELNMAMWMWYRSADPPVSQIMQSASARSQNPRIPCDGTATGCNLESAGICGQSQTAFRHRRVICNVRALWDVVDNSPSDGDGISSRSLNEVAKVLDSYWKLVATDGGAWEGYP
jgi:hypothetical protein